mgnify:CR=1 FL=1
MWRLLHKRAQATVAEKSGGVGGSGATEREKRASEREGGFLIGGGEGNRDLMPLCSGVLQHHGNSSIH